MKKTILILAANPKDTNQLRLGEEVREIEKGLERSQKRDDFDLKPKLAVQPEDVRRAMLDFQPNFVHFCGHGSGEEGILLEDDQGRAKFVNTKALADFFKCFADKLECVFLNACYSEIQAVAIGQHIPYVVGVKKAIGDTAAILFATAFYDTLGAGKSVEFAYDIACNAIQWQGLPEYTTPILVKSGDIIHKPPELNLPPPSPLSNTLSSHTQAIMSRFDDSELLANFNLSHNEISLTIHEEYSTDADEKVIHALDRLNELRKNEHRGSFFERFFPSMCFRPIRMPEVLEDHLLIDTAPINYAQWIMLGGGKHVPTKIRQHVDQQLKQVAARVPAHLQSEHKILNWDNGHPIAVMMVILTRDGKTLLRKRGVNNLTHQEQWDVSFGGYCALDDVENGTIGIRHSAVRELKQEIQTISANPRHIRFTGLHLNKKSHSLDILGIWPVEVDSDELGRILTPTKKYPGPTIVFETTARPIEGFVWDTFNLIVDFESTAIARALRYTEPQGVKKETTIYDMAPESAACLLLGLESIGKDTDGFDK